MASAMPEPHVYLKFIVDLLRFFPVDERLLVKKYIFWTYLHFFKEHNLKKRCHNLEKKA